MAAAPSQLTNTERVSPGTRLLLNAAVVALVVGSITLSWMRLDPERFWALKGLAVSTFIALGKFIVLVPVWEDEIGFSPFFLAGMVTVMDVATALFVCANLDFLHRLSWAGPRIASLEAHGRGVLRRRPWMRRLAVFGVVIFVMFPLTGTGAIGGTLFGRLVGLRHPRILLGIAIGAVLGSFGLAFGADALGAALGEIREKLWFKLLGLGVLGVFVAVLVKQGLKARSGSLENDDSHQGPGAAS